MKFKGKHLILFLIFVAFLFSCGGNADENGNKIEITWIGHSCFEIGFHECRILIDPFSPASFEKILPKKKYDIVFATHHAQDHHYFDGVEAATYLLASGYKSEFISEREDEERTLSGKTTKKTANNSFSFWTVGSFHDDQHGAVNGVNGIICLDFNGIKVVHLGDLGHVLEESHLEQIGAVDVLMIPVDGYFTIGIETARAIIRQLDPRIVFPMHYKTEKSKSTAPCNTEKELLDGFPGVKRIHRSRLEINMDMLRHHRQVIMLDFLDQRKNQQPRDQGLN
jgi:L-ascorbate metabolism protein UlaG (beta-lactamase superfamily)